MGLFDDIKAQGAAYRLNEEALFAEVLREMDAGVRRDGLWAKALSDSEMDQAKARALYIKLRVQALKDEAEVMLATFRNAIVEAATKVEAEIKIAQLAKEKERRRSEMLANARIRNQNEDAIREMGQKVKHTTDNAMGAVGVVFYGVAMVVCGLFALAFAIGAIGADTSADFWWSALGFGLFALGLWASVSAYKSGICKLEELKKSREGATD